MKTHFVLVDFENVQPENMDCLKGGPFKVKIFVGANQAKIPFKTARALQSLGPDAEYIQIEGNGSNALDFHIAYYIGRLAAEYSDAYFHIISKDSGFDPLIAHLKDRKIFCQRSASLSDIPLNGISEPKPVPEKIQAVIDDLVKRKTARPRTLKTLGNTIQALFMKQLGEREVNGLVDQLMKRGIVNVSEGKVSYQIPQPSNRSSIAG